MVLALRRIGCKLRSCCPRCRFPTVWRLELRLFSCGLLLGLIGKPGGRCDLGGGPLFRVGRFPTFVWEKKMDVSKRAFLRVGGGSGLLGLAGAASAQTTIDTTALTDVITAAGAAVVTVAGSTFAVIGAIKAYQWVRRAM